MTTRNEPTVIHVTATPDPQLKHQVCARCGAVLSSWHWTPATDPYLGTGGWTQPGLPHTLYPAGAIIERGSGWQCMSLRPIAPNCTEAVTGVAEV